VRLGADDVVLVGLDGTPGVALGARPRPLALLQHDPAGPPHHGCRAAELLVLVGGQLPAREPEPAAPHKVHGVRPAGPVERAGDRSTPVDHDRVTTAGVDVPPADVEALPARSGVTFVAPYAACGVIEPAEKERGVGDVAQGLGAVVQVRLEVLDGHAVAAQGGQREHVLPHQPQVLAGLAEVPAFGGENGGGGGGGGRGAGRGQWDPWVWLGQGAWRGQWDRWVGLGGRAWRLSRWARACDITSGARDAGTRAKSLATAIQDLPWFFPPRSPPFSPDPGPTNRDHGAIWLLGHGAPDPKQPRRAWTPWSRGSVHCLGG